MIMFTLARLAGVAIGAVALCMGLNAAAQGAGVSTPGAFPARPITMVVPFAPGGSNDVIARAIGTDLTKVLGQPVLVENKPGAGGAVGASYVARAPADGYTLMLASTSLTVTSAVQPNTQVDAVKDFTPIIQVATSPFLIVARPTFEARTPAGLLSLAKASPSKVSYGSSGLGGVVHIGMEMFASAAGVKFSHIPYKGGTPAMNDVLAGHLDLYMGTLPQLIAQVKAGKLRAIGVTSPQRARQLPEVPTLSETVPGVVVTQWWGVFAPMGLPRETLSLLNKTINESLKSPAMQKFMEAEGASPSGGSPEQFATIIQSETRRWSEVVKQNGIKVE
jgi:tripartite-type tricarboxylate transporter receptor subunit TctC